MSIDHYENFPVASLLLPKRLRPAVEVLYAFARSADDIADEGEFSAVERQRRLQAYHQELDAISANAPPLQPALAPLFQALGEIVCRHGLSVALLHDLVDAFEQDTRLQRYVDYASLLDYCRRSANPVGRLLLQLYGCATPENLVLSDRICTALQLINFWQDIAIDWQKNRVYLPNEDLQRFGVTESDIVAQRCTPAWQALMQFQVDRSRQLMCAGAPLARQLPGRIGWELRLVVLGGLRILECIKAVQYDVFQRRPTLSRLDWLRLLWRSVAYSLTTSPRAS